MGFCQPSLMSETWDLLQEKTRKLEFRIIGEPTVHASDWFVCTIDVENLNAEIA